MLMRKNRYWPLAAVNLVCCFATSALTTRADAGTYNVGAALGPVACLADTKAGGGGAETSLSIERRIGGSGQDTADGMSDGWFWMMTRLFNIFGLEVAASSMDCKTQTSGSTHLAMLGLLGYVGDSYAISGPWSARWDIGGGGYSARVSGDNSRTHTAGFNAPQVSAGFEYRVTDSAYVGGKMRLSEIYTDQTFIQTKTGQQQSLPDLRAVSLQLSATYAFK